MIGTRTFDVAEPTRFLFLQANPGHAPTLRLDEELRAVRGALQDAERSGRLVIDQRSAVRIDDAREALHRFRPHIVHFSGHGTAGGELLMPECDGGIRRVDYAPLAELFALLKGEIRLAVFNACHSSQLARAVAQHIECVVGMRDVMLDEDRDSPQGLSPRQDSGRSPRPVCRTRLRLRDELRVTCAHGRKARARIHSPRPTSTNGNAEMRIRAEARE
jgi:hypothetical protein